MDIRGIDSLATLSRLTMQTMTIVIMATGLLSGCAEEAHPPTLSQAERLGDDAVNAREQKIPIVLVVTEADCAYCMKLKREVIQPILISGDYERRAIFREMRMRPAYPLKGFDLEPVQSNVLARRYAITVVPTVLVLGPDGTEQAKRLIGINNVEMYGYYLDQAIQSATAAIARD